MSCIRTARVEKCVFLERFGFGFLGGFLLIYEQFLDMLQDAN